jgi:hypothetical protein
MTALSKSRRRQGHNRRVRALRSAAPAGFPRCCPKCATYRDTGSEPGGPRALSGEDTVRVAAAGQTPEELSLRDGARGPTQPAGHALSAYDALGKAAAPSPRQPSRNSTLGRVSSPARGPLGWPNQPARQLPALMHLSDNSDAPPTTQAIAVLAAVEAQPQRSPAAISSTT